MRCLHPPLEGEGRLALSEANGRRGGVTVSGPDTAHEERLSLRPAARFTRVDPAPPGQRKKTPRRGTIDHPATKIDVAKSGCRASNRINKKDREVSACRQSN